MPLILDLLSIADTRQSETRRTELTQSSDYHNMNNLERLIETCVELGSAKTLETLGLTSGEISFSKAKKIYGKWFTDAYASQRIFPCRVENGRAGTIWFRVVDILKLKAYDSARAELIIT